MQQNKDEKKFVSHRDLSIFIWNKQFVVMYCCLQISIGDFSIGLLDFDHK